MHRSCCQREAVERDGVRHTAERRLQRVGKGALVLVFKAAGQKAANKTKQMEANNPKPVLDQICFYVLNAPQV